MPSGGHNAAKVDDACICAWINTQKSKPSLRAVQRQFSTGADRAKRCLETAIEGLKSPAKETELASGRTKVQRGQVVEVVPFTDKRRSPIKIRNKPGGEIRDEAKAFLIHEYYTAKAQGSLAKLTEHYDVGKNWFTQNVGNLKKRKSLEHNKQFRGARSKWSEDTTNALREANRKYNRQASAETLARCIGWGATRVREEMKGSKWRETRIKPRPKLTEDNIAERKVFCQHALSGDPKKRKLMWIDTVDYDEKIFELPGFSGKVKHHVDSPLKEEVEYPKCQSRRYIPKIMVGAAIARPMWNAKKRDWDKKKNGKVCLVRCWDEFERGTNRYEYEVIDGKKTRVGKQYSKGDKYMKDTTVDGELHCKLMKQQILPAIRAYYGPKCKGDIGCQQDGAGGHAIYSEHMKDIEADASGGQPSIYMHTQPPNSPGFNACDKGLWPMLVKAAAMAAPKTVEELWKALEAAFKELSEGKLDNIFEAKTVECVQVLELDGKGITKERHGKYRTAKRRNKGAPVSLEFKDSPSAQ